MYLGIVLGVACVQRNRLEVQPAVKVDSGDDVPLKNDEHEQSYFTSLADYTHCSVGVMPLGPCVAEGVATGVAGVTPFPLAAGWPLEPGRWVASPLLPGGVSSFVAPGNDNDPGAVNAFACAALDGCV